MSLRSDIKKYANPKDKQALLWLLDRYHSSSEWSFIAGFKQVRYGYRSYEVHNVWFPTKEGRCIYDNMRNDEEYYAAKNEAYKRRSWHD